jgi:xylulokinase/glycerol kinase
VDTILVVDVGTSSLRSTAATLGGSISLTASRNYSPVFLGGPRVEQDPSSWTDALFDTLLEVADFSAAGKHRTLAVSVTSQRASVIPVDSDGRPLRSALMWQDKRSVAECERILSRISMEDIYRKTGLRLDPYFSAPKMMWLLANEGELCEGAAKFIGVQDLVVHALTSRFVTDASQACRTMLMDIRAQSWDDEMLDLVGVPESKLPEILPPGSIGGTLTSSAAARAGLPAGIPVILAGGDQQNAALALNVLAPGTVEATAGTGSFMIAFADQPRLDPRMRTLCSCGAEPASWVVEAGLLTSGALYSWVNEQAFRGLRFRDIDAEVSASPAGANGVVALPHFKGSAAPYWNPRAKGVFFGIGLDTTRETSPGPSLKPSPLR